MKNNTPPKMSANNAAAALALATHISQPQVPQAPQDASVSPEIAPGQPVEQETPTTQEPQENEQITQLTRDFDEFRGKIEGVIDSKFNELTQTLKNALK